MDFVPTSLFTSFKNAALFVLVTPQVGLLLMAFFTSCSIGSTPAPLTNSEVLSILKEREADRSNRRSEALPSESEVSPFHFTFQFSSCVLIDVVYHRADSAICRSFNISRPGIPYQPHGNNCKHSQQHWEALQISPLRRSSN